MSLYSFFTKCPKMSGFVMLSACFPRFWTSRIHGRRFVFLFSMVCVEGSGWAGVILPDKVAIFR